MRLKSGREHALTSDAKVCPCLLLATVSIHEYCNKCAIVGLNLWNMLVRSTHNFKCILVKFRRNIAIPSASVQLHSRILFFIHRVDACFVHLTPYAFDRLH